MPRSVTISYCRMTSTPATSFDPSTGTGTIGATYTVGTYTPAAGTKAAIYLDCPTAVLVGTASVPLGPNDTAGAKLAQLVGTMLAQEGLTLGVDYCFTAGGQVLAGVALAASAVCAVTGDLAGTLTVR